MRNKSSQQYREVRLIALIGRSGTLGKTLPGSHMSQQNLVEIAKQGDARAISQLINRSLNPKGINAKVILREGCLKIMLEASPIPGKEIADYVHRGIVGLDIPEISSLVVYARQPGDEFPAWTEEFNLDVFGELASQSIVPESIPSESDICCPRCQSSQVMISKKGFGVGKAAAGALLLGPVGLAGGMIGSNQAMLSCLKCGHQWQPGKPDSKSKQVDSQSPEVIYANQWTPATFKKATQSDRIGRAIATPIMFGVGGLLLAFIPVLGWVLCPICLLIAVYAPFMYLNPNDNSLDRWSGKCPRCEGHISMQSDKKATQCSHCQANLLFKDEKFYILER